MPSILTMKLFPSPPVGFPVVWYPQAQSDRKELGRAAIVTHSGTEGRISLTAFPKGTAMRAHRDVRHVIDPIHKRKTETTMRNGGWDFIAGFDQTLYRPEIVDLEFHLRLSIAEGNNVADDQLRENVMVLFSQSYTIEQIAGRLQEPLEKVEAVVKEILGARSLPPETKTLEQLVEEAVAKALAPKEKPTTSRGRGKSSSVSPKKEEVLS